MYGCAASYLSRRRSSVCLVRDLLRAPQIPRATVGLALTATPRALELAGLDPPDSLALTGAVRLDPVKLHDAVLDDPTFERAAAAARIHAFDPVALLRQRDLAVAAVPRAGDAEGLVGGNVRCHEREQRGQGDASHEQIQRASLRVGLTAIS